LQVGGISALALLIAVSRFASMSPRSRSTQIHISAGQRGVDICLAVQDLVEVTRAKRVHATGGV